MEDVKSRGAEQGGRGGCGIGYYGLRHLWLSFAVASFQNHGEFDASCFVARGADVESRGVELGGSGRCRAWYYVLRHL
jgi:hypothetical protein